MSRDPKAHVALRPGSRLWPVFELLRDRGAAGATTLELSEILADRGRPDFNISSSLSDIRKVCGSHGYAMLPAVPEGSRQVGSAKRKLYRYRLVRIGEAVPPVATSAPVLAPAAPVAPVAKPGAQSIDLFGDSRPPRPR